MKRQFAPEHVDVAALADAAQTVSDRDSLSRYPRLAAETSAPDGGSEVIWQVLGQRRLAPDGSAAPWIHLRADAVVLLVCQRCLGPVEAVLQVDRWFRFAPDEATAAAQDETAEEDVLVASRDFDLRTLVEDELLMELPVVPRHPLCPEAVRLSVADEAFDTAQAARPRPFAALDKLRARKPQG